MGDFNKSQCGNLKGARGGIADAVAAREGCTLNEDGNVYTLSGCWNSDFQFYWRTFTSQRAPVEKESGPPATGLNAPFDFWNGWNAPSCRPTATVRLGASMEGATVGLG